MGLAHFQHVLLDVDDTTVLQLLVQLDAFEKNVRHLSFLEQKLVWNFISRFTYGKKAWLFSGQESESLLEPCVHQDFVVPRFIGMITGIYGEDHFVKAFAWGTQTNFGYEIYLINMILYLMKENFKDSSLPDYVLTWLNKPFQGGDGWNISFPNVVVSYKLHEQGPFDVSSRDDCLRLMGAFFLERAPNIRGYDYAQDYRDVMLGPSAWPSLSLIAEAVWHCLPYAQAQYDLTDADARAAWACEFQAQYARLMDPQDQTSVVVAARPMDQPVSSSKPLPDFPETQREDGPETLEEGGVNLVGWVRTEIGIGEDVRMAALAMRAEQFPYCILDAAEIVKPYPRQVDTGFESDIVPSSRFKTDIVFLDVLTQYKYYFYKRMKGVLRDRKVIVVAPWELPAWPDHLSFLLETADEFWAASQYIFGIFEQYFPRGTIKLAPPAVDISNFLPEIDTSRNRGGRPFRFLTVFDGLSSIDRKNPMVTVRAFRVAFPASDTSVELVIKTMNFKPQSEKVQALIAAMGGDPRISLINETLEKIDVLKLAATADCFVSLHRAEGFGRNIAEAMILGVPVLCSAHSGNMDFCHESTSTLVSGKLVPVQPGEYALAEGQSWFDADVESAMVGMKSIVQDYEKALVKAENAKAYMRQHHSAEAVGRNYRRLLRGEDGVGADASRIKSSQKMA